MHNILSSMLYESLNNDSKKLLVKLQKLIIKADKILELIECFTELPQKYIDIEVAKMAKQYIANVNQLCTGLSIKVPKFYITNEDEAQKLAESTIDIAYINKMYKTLELVYNFCVEYNISSAIFSWQKQPPYTNMPSITFKNTNNVTEAGVTKYKNDILLFTPMKFVKEYLIVFKTPK